MNARPKGPDATGPSVAGLYDRVSGGGRSGKSATGGVVGQLIRMVPPFSPR